MCLTLSQFLVVHLRSINFLDACSGKDSYVSDSYSNEKPLREKSKIIKMENVLDRYRVGIL